MKNRGHPYREGRLGRSIVTRPGVGTTTSRARLVCAGCGHAHFLSLRAVMPPDQIDQKFKQAGWQLDPHRCPDCIAAAALKAKLGAMSRKFPA